MEPLIEIKKLSKSFNGKNIFKNLDINIYPKEIIVLIGPSGSGKSTLVRCIADLEKYDSGQILFNNKSKNEKIKTGMVFQNFNLFPHYTVLENISKPLQVVKKMKKDNAEEIAHRLLSKVHLEDQFNQYPSTLSGGQKQRVAIARSLSMKPEIMIFDEPTSSLDPELALEVFSTIKELANDGQTMIIVTHQISAVKHIATRVLFLHNGNIRVDSNVENTLVNPADEVLKDFISTVDFESL